MISFKVNERGFSFVELKRNKVVSKRTNEQTNEMREQKTVERKEGEGERKNMNK